MHSIHYTHTIIEKYLPTNALMRISTKIMLVMLGTALLTLSAKINVPMYPVPMTMQTLVVILIGFILGPIYGVSTVALYLLQGALGLPVFAGTPEKGIGLAYMVGPTGGYLFGFLIAALFAAYMQSIFTTTRIITSAVIMLIGHCIIYLFGLIYLGSFIGYSEKVFVFGMMPFILGDITKIALGALLIPKLMRVTKTHAQQ